MDKWLIYCKKADFAAISQKFNISPMFARILVNRGIDTDEKIGSFLNHTVANLYDPFLFREMKKAVEATEKVISSGGKIRIIGDYDVDGVCASYILYRGISFAGGNADVRLPHRVNDGYGMNEEMAEEAKKDGIDLIVTCDNGISANAAVTRANELGIPVIITDHHEVSGEVPDAFAIIDAKCQEETYPFRELCGAAVAYKFVDALLTACGNCEGADVIRNDLLTFAGIATIADIVSLQDENRIFAKACIINMKNTQHKGLKALMQVKGLERSNLRTYHIGFIIGPSINSAGRLDDPRIAFDLLCADTDEKAMEIASVLHELNEKRKSLTMEQANLAADIINAQIEKNGTLPKVIVVYLKDAHESIAGIIAGKIKEKYSHPAFVVTQSEGEYKGSGRSIDDYNMIDALVRHSELFERFGGHAKAAGFTLKCTPDELEEALNNDPEIEDIEFNKKVWIDMQLPFAYATEGFVNELDSMEPCGMDNERPLFAMRDVEFSSVKLVGQNQNVLKVIMKDPDGSVIDGVMFGHGQCLNETYEKITEQIQKGINRFSIIFCLNINEFRGSRYVQAIIEGINFPDK